MASGDPDAKPPVLSLFSAFRVLYIYPYRRDMFFSLSASLPCIAKIERPGPFNFRRPRAGAIRPPYRERNLMIVTSHSCTYSHNQMLRKSLRCYVTSYSQRARFESGLYYVGSTRGHCKGDLSSCFKCSNIPTCQAVLLRTYQTRLFFESSRMPVCSCESNFVSPSRPATCILSLACASIAP